MSREDKGHYKRKHPEGSKMNPETVELIKNHSRDGRISCKSAHEIAAEAGISPGAVGKTIDLLEFRITECQLGVFGYKNKEHRIVNPAEIVPNNVKARILEGAKDNTISCLSLWQAAEDLGLSRLEISAANETVGVKICCCQLGAF